MGQDSYLAYPLKFNPIFKEKIWGGQGLKKELGRPIAPTKKVGESWEVAWLDNDISIVCNGPYEGRLFSDLVEQFPEAILGRDIAQRFPDRFPLLFKLIDAQEPISVQVHPSDEYAADLEDGQWGKTEMWYVLKAGPDSKVICGLKDWANPENFAAAIANAQVKESLESCPVSAGDTVYIPAGRVHGTMGPLLLLEVQENSNLTYRLHDWGRLGPGQKPRKLQIEKALECIEYHDEEEGLVNPIVTKKTDEVEERLLVTCDYFTIEKISFPIFYQDSCDGEKFVVYFIASGKGEIAPAGMSEEAMTFRKGDFLFLPASLGNIQLQTDEGCEIIKTIVT